MSFMDDPSTELFYHRGLFQYINTDQITFLFDHALELIHFIRILQI